MSMLIGTVEDAVAAGRRRSFAEGSFRGAADYLFETLPGEALGPQALIARQAPGWSLPVHFHMQHQFQVVLRGSGTLGAHALAPGNVHYTSPQSAYGPIVAGPGGLDYFTLRVLTDKGAWYLPQARGVMQMGMFKEQKWGAPQTPDAPCETVIAPRADGLAAWACRPRPGQPMAIAIPPGEAGRFHLVIEGRLRVAGRELAAGSCVYCLCGDAPEFTALTPDALLVAVQFPDHALSNDVPPELRIAPSPRGTAVAD